MYPPEIHAVGADQGRTTNRLASSPHLTRLTFSLWPMFSSAPLRSFCLLTLLTGYFPSVLTQHAGPILEKRDAFSSSGLASASWIWLPEPDLLTTAPTGSVAFIKTLTTPPGKTAASALITIAVDNNFTLWCNAQPVGASDGIVADGWQTAHVLSVALNTTSNVFSVLGTNAGPSTAGAADPAGLLAAIRIFYTDGSNETVLSDNTWLVSGTIPPDFPVPLDLSSFVHAQVATKYGSGPWATSVTVPSPNPNALNLTGSSWIWSTSNASIDTLAVTVGFRKTVATPAGKSATSAIVLLTADNTFQLLVNGQYVGSPPFDNNLGPTSSWQYAQRFTVALAATRNVFTVLATNFPGQQTGGGSSAGLVAAVQILYSDGTSEILRTDASWLTGPSTANISFLTLSDSILGAAVLQGPFGMAPWGQLSGTSDALSVLRLPANNAAMGVPSPVSTMKATSNTLSAPTTILPATSPSASAIPAPDASGARAIGTLDGRTLLMLVLVLSIVTLFIL
ncbi:hypothetical protein DFH08DRAFT_1081824 [Mycena albidolilacea]|uniref:Uncharacterized protein n=1 Tax=Mycena albidolilacea TaxID=1033008 RepID=A0AAD6ZWV9_9AGAR|nr:hypothetical protein DFH08DRAFT_1081824 [Mycena albidolilacea]